MAFIYDQEICIRLKDLRLLGLLNGEYNRKEVTVTVSRGNGLIKEISSFQIEVSTQFDDSYLKIRFAINGNPITQRLALVKKSNNMAGGYRWFILCPITGKECINLYLEGDCFKSRVAIKNGSYKIRAIKYGRKRSLFIAFNNALKAQKAIAKMKKPNAKRYYRGMVTESNKRALIAKQTLKRIAATL